MHELCYSYATVMHSYSKIVYKRDTWSVQQLSVMNWADRECVSGNKVHLIISP